MIFLVTLKGDYGKCVHAQQGLNIINIICKSQVIFCLIQHKSPKETLRLQGEIEILFYIDCAYLKRSFYFIIFLFFVNYFLMQKGYLILNLIAGHHINVA